MIVALSTSDVNPLVPSWGILGFMLALNAVLFIAALVSIVVCDYIAEQGIGDRATTRA